jgi:hypothetical protein
MLNTPDDWTAVPAVVGNSTCAAQCDAGYSSNGTPLHECQKCSPQCATCMDNREAGDIDKCTSCSASHPFMYSPLSKCMESCGLGYYQVNAENCDACSAPCSDCAGDKFNCTRCDAEAPEKALFVQTIGKDAVGEDIARGTCYRQCPNGYFEFDVNENNTLPASRKCASCQDPCGTCEGRAHQCLSCDGTDNLRYVWEYGCYEACPNKTAPDMSTLRCIGCAPNCNQCGTQEGPSCY